MTHFLYHSSLLRGSNEEPPKKLGQTMFGRELAIPDNTDTIIYFEEALAKWIENAGVCEPECWELREAIWKKYRQPGDAFYESWKRWQPLEDHFYTLDVECEIVDQWRYKPTIYATGWCDCYATKSVYNEFAAKPNTETRKICRLINKQGELGCSREMSITQEDASPTAEVDDKNEVSEIIAKVHDDIEGRYVLDSYDKGVIHSLLCKLQ